MFGILEFNSILKNCMRSLHVKNDNKVNVKIDIHYNCGFLSFKQEVRESAQVFSEDSVSIIWRQKEFVENLIGVWAQIYSESKFESQITPFHSLYRECYLKTFTII